MNINKNNMLNIQSSEDVKSHEEPANKRPRQRHQRFSLDCQHGELSVQMTSAVKIALIQETMHDLTAMKETGQMHANSPLSNVNAFHYKETKDWWNTKYQNLFGTGRSQCNPHECANMKDRLRKHRLICPCAPKTTTTSTADTGATKLTGDTAATTSTCDTVAYVSAMDKMDKACSTFTRMSIASSTNELNRPSVRNAESCPTETDVIREKNCTGILMKPIDSDTQELIANIKLYREKLTSEIQECFHEIPVFPNTSEAIKEKRAKMINEFIDDIANLFYCIDNDDYYNKVMGAIEFYIRDLPMWLPEKQKERDVFKGCVGATLLNFVKAFNEQWYSLRKCSQSLQTLPTSVVVYNPHVNGIMENNIIHLLEICYGVSDKINVLGKILIKKLKPVLEAGISGAHELKRKILTILEELSLNLNESKKPERNKWATDYILHALDEKNGLRDTLSCMTRNGKEPVVQASDVKVDYDYEEDTVNQITDALFGEMDLVLHEQSPHVQKKIHSILKLTGEFSDSEAASLAETLVTNVKKCFNKEVHSKEQNSSYSSLLLALTSEHELSEKSCSLFYSTPKTYVRKKEITTLNKAEINFVENVSVIVRNWLDTTDETFDTMAEQIYKEVVDADITNNVYDIVKQSIQLKIPGVNIEQGLLNIVIIKAIKQYELFTNPVTDMSPPVVELREKIMALDSLLDSSAVLKQQHGNTQAMANIKTSNSNESKYRQEDYHLSKALDILEDNISVWMNEQSSDIFRDIGKPPKAQLMRELATNLQKKMANKNSEEIKNVLMEWLHKIVKPEMGKYIDELAGNLKDKIIKLSQDETLTRACRNRMNEYEREKITTLRSDKDDKHFDFINKFVDRNFQIKNDVVKAVMTMLIKQDLNKLSPAVRENLYKNDNYDEMNVDKYENALEIIDEIYDWLKNIPFYYPLLQPGTETINFVYGLAKTIVKLKTERVKYGNRLDYDSWLQTEVALCLLQKEKALTNENKLKLDDYAVQLCSRIANLRKDDGDSKISKIVAEYMKKYDSRLVKDYLKKVLWHRRLNKKIMSVYDGNPAPSRAEVDDALQSIPIPRAESVQQFKVEIKYNTAIHDWMRNLPLKPSKDDEEELKRRDAIQKLLQKIVEIEETKNNNPNGTKANNNLGRYLANWLSQKCLKLTTSCDIPVLVKRLENALEYIKWTENHLSLTTSIVEVATTSILDRNRPSKGQTITDPGEQLVDAIESWCNNLPLDEDNVDIEKTKKEQVATNIFQVLGSLCDNPRMNNGGQKFKELLAEGIDAQLDNLSEYDTVKENKEDLKLELVEKIIEIKNIIRDTTAGDEYVHILENSIDMSLPNSPRFSSSANNPGYELFKKRMVMFWLLENYDYTVDFHSLKCKKMLSDEIDLLSEEIKKANMLPEDNDEVMADVMDQFYKTKPPNEDAIIHEVEKIKMRCEIESWIKELPLKETFGYKQLLERDQILSILTKILYDIEQGEDPNKHDKMKKEIMRWAIKLPLLPGEDDKLDAYADLLICILKSNANARKCQRQADSTETNLTTVKETLHNLKSSDEFNKKKELNATKTSQEAGPSRQAGTSGIKPCENKKYGVSQEELNDLITSAITNWCNLLPLTYDDANQENVAQKTKQYVAKRLQYFVSELNYRPNTLSNEGLYEHYLNNELESILSQLTNARLYWEAQGPRTERKFQLINALKAIRPLVQDGREREVYKEKLKRSISSFNESMPNYTEVQLSKEAQSAIIDDFIRYKSHKGDFESQELDKNKINDTVRNELNARENNADPLLTANRLICEMSKVKPPPTYQRRFSLPEPHSGINCLPSGPAVRRGSLPYPLPQMSKVAPSQEFPKNPPVPLPLRQPYPAMRSIPTPAPREMYGFPKERIPMADPRTMSSYNGHESPDLLQASMPVHVHGSIPLPYPLPRTRYTFPDIAVRPFAVAPPVPSRRNDNSYRLIRAPFVQLPQASYRGPDVRPHFVEPENRAEQSSRASDPQNVEQRNPFLHAPRERAGESGTRTTASVRYSPRSGVVCPKEQQQNDRKGVRGSERERRRSGGGGAPEYCMTCNRDRDCEYPIPRPYPMPD